MASLLNHMVEITTHRDHLMLDRSVVTALYDLIGAEQVRALEIFRLRDSLYLRPLVSMCGGKISSIDEKLGAEQSGEPLDRYPALVASMESRKSSATEKSADGKYMLWLPVWINDKVTSCLEVVNSKPYPKSTLGVIQGILNVYSNYQSLLDYSERDSLTGLLNRKTFDEKFSRMVAASAQDETAAGDDRERRQPSESKEQWLAVVDIDHFKRVNDQFGHLYGDEVLILVANILRSSFRTHDRIFRFGGEEFVILLRSATLAEAKMIFERFRQNVEDYEFPQVGRVTVSLGFTGISYETPVVILGHADQALYYAKDNGRNRVCHYNELLSSGDLHVETQQESVEFFFDDPTPA